MAQTDNQKSKRGCLLPAVLILVLMPIVLVTLVVSVWYLRESSARNRWINRIAELRSQGYPVDNASVEAMYFNRTDETKTREWLDAFQTLESSEFKESASDIPFVKSDASVPLEGAWSDEKAIRRFLEEWRNFRSELTKLASEAKPVRFPIVFDSFNSRLPYTNKTINAARFLQLCGRVALRDRDSALVCQSIESILGASHVNAEEPMTVSRFVSDAIAGIALDLLQAALERDALNTDDLERLLSKYKLETSIGKDWNVPLMGERGLAIPIFRDPSAAGLTVPHLLTRYSDANYYLDTLEPYQDLPHEDLDAFLSQLDDCDEKNRMLLDAGGFARLDTILTRQILPAYSQFGREIVGRVSFHRLAVLAIGVRLYEDRHGGMPQSLSDLSEFAIDAKELMPSGGKPFGYRIDGSEATLWGFVWGLKNRVSHVPPVTSRSDPYAELNDKWVWKLKSGRR